MDGWSIFMKESNKISTDEKSQRFIYLLKSLTHIETIHVTIYLFDITTCVHLFSSPPCPLTIPLSFSPLPLSGPPGSSAGFPLRSTFQRQSWEGTAGHIPAPGRPVGPPWCPQRPSCRSPSVQKSRAPRRFSQTRTPVSPRQSAAGKQLSAPSSRWEPTDPTGQQQSHPPEWIGAMSVQLWRKVDIGIGAFSIRSSC